MTTLSLDVAPLRPTTQAAMDKLERRRLDFNVRYLMLWSNLLPVTGGLNTDRRRAQLGHGYDRAKRSF